MEEGWDGLAEAFVLNVGVHDVAGNGVQLHDVVWEEELGGEDDDLFEIF